MGSEAGMQQGPPATTLGRQSFLPSGHCLHPQKPFASQHAAVRGLQKCCGEGKFGDTPSNEAEFGQTDGRT